MSNLVRNVRATIGGEESTPGTSVSRTAVIPISGLPSVMKTAEKQTDPVIAGRNMDAGEFSVAFPVGGALPLSPRPVAGMGMLYSAWLGKQQSSPDQVGACIRLRYTGSEASAKISADTTADTISSAVGDKGSESADSSFGSSGSIDLTATATDTVGELVSTIDGYTNYDCEKVFGDDSIDAGEIITITQAQGKDKWVYVWFSSSSSGIYRHVWEVVLGNTQRPTYSIQIDKMHDNFLYAGNIVNELSFDGALQGVVSAEAQILGMTEKTGQSAYSGSALPNVEPYLFQQGGFSLGGNDYTFLRSVNITGTNNATEDGYGQGSLERQYHEKGKFDLSGSFQLRYSTEIYGHRADVFNDAQVALSLHFKSVKDLATNIPGLILHEMPNIQLQSYEPTERDGKIDASINWKAFNPDDAYDPAYRLTMLSTKSTVHD